MKFKRMLLRVAHLLAVGFAFDDPSKADFLNPKSVEEIVKLSSDPIPNDNCKSKYAGGPNFDPVKNMKEVVT